MNTVATTIDYFIGGAPSAAGDGRREEIHNPANGDVIAHAPLSGAADVDAAVRAAEGAFEGWSQTGGGQHQSF